MQPNQEKDPTPGKIPRSRVLHRPVISSSFSAMPSRLYHGVMLLLIVVGLSGCFQSTGGPLDEEKNPYLIAGRDWANARDYERAMEKFHKALESQPGSALAHYELGHLYEKHRKDYVSAIYHYQRARDLRPDEYPTDNARVRIASCKHELVRKESLAPVAKDMLRELETLRSENIRLKAALAEANALARNNPSEPRQPIVRTPREPILTPTPDRKPRVVGAETTRQQSHTIKRGDTLYSISKRYGISQTALKRSNPALDASNLPVGKRIIIPSR